VLVGVTEGVGVGVCVTTQKSQPPKSGVPKFGPPGPENSTKEQPPEVPEGHFLTWNDGWVLEQIIPPTPQQKLESLGLTVEVDMCN
jgi:hypothetical protein